MAATFPHYPQHDAMDCGAACLRMIAKYHGKSYSAETLRKRSHITREGVSLLGISDAAESIGMPTSQPPQKNSLPSEKKQQNTLAL